MNEVVSPTVMTCAPFGVMEPPEPALAVTVNSLVGCSIKDAVTLQLVVIAPVVDRSYQ